MPPHRPSPTREHSHLNPHPYGSDHRLPPLEQHTPLSHYNPLTDITRQHATEKSILPPLTHPDTHPRHTDDPYRSLQQPSLSDTPSLPHPSLSRGLFFSLTHRSRSLAAPDALLLPPPSSAHQARDIPLLPDPRPTPPNRPPSIPHNLTRQYSLPQLSIEPSGYPSSTLTLAPLLYHRPSHLLPPTPPLRTSISLSELTNTTQAEHSQPLPATLNETLTDSPQQETPPSRQLSSAYNTKKAKTKEQKPRRLTTREDRSISTNTPDARARRQRAKNRRNDHTPRFPNSDDENAPLETVTQRDRRRAIKRLNSDIPRFPNSDDENAPLETAKQRKARQSKR